MRLLLTGSNASGQTYYLSVSGLEFYGEIRGLADQDLGNNGCYDIILGVCTCNTFLYVDDAETC